MYKEQYPDGKNVIANIDSGGNVTSLQYPDGSQVTSVFDELDRLTSISGFGGSVAFGYDSASRRDSQIAVTHSVTLPGLDRITLPVEKHCFKISDCQYGKGGVG